MLVQELLDLAQKAHLRSEMEIFLSHLLRCSRLDVIVRSKENIPARKLVRLQRGWIQLQDGLPIAYLTHQKEFYGLSFYVNQDVLIPRPETEKLVDLALKYAKKGVLELGTGCGAIACALKRNRPKLKIRASDISFSALQIANKNCVQLRVKLELVQSDLLESLSRGEEDVLVANLPYIGSRKHSQVEAHVAKYEPSLALFGGTDGLSLYRRLFDQVREQKRKFQFILGEIGFSQGKAIQKLCKKKLSDYRFSLLQDLQGLDRYFVLERR